MHLEDGGKDKDKTLEKLFELADQYLQDPVGVGFKPTQVYVPLSGISLTPLNNAAARTVETGFKPTQDQALVSGVRRTSDPPLPVVRTTSELFDGERRIPDTNATPFNSYPNLQKLKALQQKEKQIDFTQANLEQRALLQEMEARGRKQEAGSNVGELRGMIEKLNQSKNQRLSQLSLLKQIFQILKEKNINLSLYPHLQMYYQYLEEFSQIDLDQLLDEEQRLEDQVYKKILDGRWRMPARQSFGGGEDGGKERDKSSKKRLGLTIAPVSRHQGVGGQAGVRRTSDLSSPMVRTTLELFERERGIPDSGAYPVLNTALLLRAIDRYLNLLVKAYSIQMTTQDFKCFQINEPDFGTIPYLAFLNTQLIQQGYTQDLIPYKDILEKGKEALLAFYDSVDKRDLAFVENTKAALSVKRKALSEDNKRNEAGNRRQEVGKDEAGSMKQETGEQEAGEQDLSFRASSLLPPTSVSSPTAYRLSLTADQTPLNAYHSPQVAVLITGGYHTPHLKKLFTDQGYSFITLTPIVTSPTNQKKYEELLLEPILPKVKRVEVVSGESRKQDSLSDIPDLIQFHPKKNDGVRAMLVEAARLALGSGSAYCVYTQMHKEALSMNQALSSNDGARLSSSSADSADPKSIPAFPWRPRFSLRSLLICFTVLCLAFPIVFNGIPLMSHKTNGGFYRFLAGITGLKNFTDLELRHLELQKRDFARQMLENNFSQSNLMVRDIECIRGSDDISLVYLFRGKGDDGQWRFFAVSINPGDLWVREILDPYGFGFSKIYPTPTGLCAIFLDQGSALDFFQKKLLECISDEGGMESFATKILGIPKTHEVQSVDISRSEPIQMELNTAGDSVTYLIKLVVVSLGPDGIKYHCIMHVEVSDDPFGIIIQSVLSQNWGIMSKVPGGILIEYSSGALRFERTGGGRGSYFSEIVIPGSPLQGNVLIYPHGEPFNFREAITDLRGGLGPNSPHLKRFLDAVGGKGSNDGSGARLAGESGLRTEGGRGLRNRNAAARLAGEERPGANGGRFGFIDLNGILSGPQTPSPRIVFPKLRPLGQLLSPLSSQSQARGESPTHQAIRNLKINAEATKDASDTLNLVRQSLMSIDGLTDNQFGVMGQIQDASIIVSDDFWEYAAVDTVDGKPLILMNSHVFNALSRTQRIHVIGHELGHLFFGGHRELLRAGAWHGIHFDRHTLESDFEDRCDTVGVLAVKQICPRDQWHEILSIIPILISQDQYLGNGPSVSTKSPTTGDCGVRDVHRPDDDRVAFLETCLQTESGQLVLSVNDEWKLEQRSRTGLATEMLSVLDQGWVFTSSGTRSRDLRNPLAAARLAGNAGSMANQPQAARLAPAQERFARGRSPYPGVRSLSEQFRMMVVLAYLRRAHEARKRQERSVSEDRFIRIYQTSAPTSKVLIVDWARPEFFDGSSLLLLAMVTQERVFDGLKSGQPIPLLVRFADESQGEAVARVTGQIGTNRVRLEIGSAEYIIEFPPVVIKQAREALGGRTPDELREAIRTSQTLSQVVPAIHALSEYKEFIKDKAIAPQQTYVIVVPADKKISTELQRTLESHAQTVSRESGPIEVQFVTVSKDKLFSMDGSEFAFPKDRITKVFGDPANEALVSAVQGKAGLAPLPEIRMEEEGQIQMGNYLLAFILADMLARVDLSKLPADQTTSKIKELANDAHVREVFSMIYQRPQGQLHAEDLALVIGALTFFDDPSVVPGLIQKRFPPFAPIAVNRALTAARLAYETVGSAA